jgi:hypothetical protein
MKDTKQFCCECGSANFTVFEQDDWHLRLTCIDCGESIYIMVG